MPAKYPTAWTDHIFLIHAPAGRLGEHAAGGHGCVSTWGSARFPLFWGLEGLEKDVPFVRLKRFPSVPSLFGIFIRNGNVGVFCQMLFLRLLG